MRTRLLVALSCLTVLASCTKSTTENTYTTQSESIEKYVTSLLDNDPDLRVVYNEGVVRVIIEEGTGDELARDGSASLLYA